MGFVHFTFVFFLFFFFNFFLFHDIILSTHFFLIKKEKKNQFPFILSHFFVQWKALLP